MTALRKLTEERPLNLKPQPIRYRENGFRSVPVDETLSRFSSFILSSGFQVKMERKELVVPELPVFLFHFLSPNGKTMGPPFRGKGLTEQQCEASAAMEFLERVCSRRGPSEAMIKASYPDVRTRARNPARFIVPRGPAYEPSSKIEWVWGYSLTRHKPLMVPANLVFWPYSPQGKARQIVPADSNGLASGNVLEEAILHGLLEVVERDARIIMEYNRLNMPDIRLRAKGHDALSELFRKLEASGIRYKVKDITTDIPIPSYGVFLSGRHSGREARAFASGTHLDPRIALSRALTEALQMYPRCRNYREWIRSGPLDHLSAPSKKKGRSGRIKAGPFGDLKSAVESCVETLKAFDAEVIVVDLSLPETGFAVVRVCVTGLQPVIVPSVLRLSRRLFETPRRLGYETKTLKADEIKPRELCGFSFAPPPF